MTSRLQLREGWGRFLLLGIGLALLALDQSIKILLHVRMIAGHDAIRVSRWIDLSFNVNSGAAFGLPLRGSLYFLLFVVLVGVFVYTFRHMFWKHPLVFTVLIAGVLSNFLDRAILGVVIDYIDIHRFPIFNFADVYILTSVCVLVYKQWRA